MKVQGAALAAGSAAACLLFVVATADRSQAEIRSSTEYASYEIAGTTPLTVLRSMLQRAKWIGHDGALATTRTSLKVNTDFDGRSPCRVTGTVIEANFLITLPEHPDEGHLSPRARAAYLDFHKQAKRHEEKHRAIYLSCAKRLDRAIDRLPPAPNCRALKRQADALWAKEMKRCAVENKAFDTAESKRLANAPLLRDAVASYESQARAQIEASKITSFKVPETSRRSVFGRIVGDR